MRSRALARACLLAPLAPLAPLLAACSGELGVTVRAELMRLPDATPLGQVVAAARSVPPWTSNVTLTSIRSPITRVELRSATAGIALYECPGATSVACRIELNGPALHSLLPTTAVRTQPGTYDQIVIGYCGTSETGWSALLTGTTTLAGTTYYTRTTGNQLGTSGPAQPVSVSFNGCASPYPIVPPLVIADTTATILVRLYFDLRDLAYAALNDAMTNQLLLGTGCSGPSTTGFLCAAYTTIFAVPGTAVPAVERYRVNDNVTIGLVFEATADRFVGGYTRRYYIEDAGYSPGFNPDGHYDVFTPSGPGTYLLTQSYGSEVNVFPAFERATHTGTMTSNTGMSITYTAVRLP